MKALQHVRAYLSQRGLQVRSLTPRYDIDIESKGTWLLQVAGFRGAHEIKAIVKINRMSNVIQLQVRDDSTHVTLFNAGYTDDEDEERKPYYGYDDDQLRVWYRTMLVLYLLVKLHKENKINPDTSLSVAGLETKYQSNHDEEDEEADVDVFVSGDHAYPTHVHDLVVTVMNAIGLEVSLEADEYVQSGGDNPVDVSAIDLDTLLDMSKLWQRGMSSTRNPRYQDRHYNASGRYIPSGDRIDHGITKLGRTSGVALAFDNFMSQERDRETKNIHYGDDLSSDASSSSNNESDSDSDE
jgi:hypothetical protein